MGFNGINLWQKESQIAKVIETNPRTAKFGLSLTEEEAELIVREKSDVLKRQRRVEFGAGITEKLIFEFCDSVYLDSSNYVETIIRLQEIFYCYKNEVLDEVSDDELLHFMKKQFETRCHGDLDYLESTCMENFARAIRAGYDPDREEWE